MPQDPDAPAPDAPAPDIPAPGIPAPGTPAPGTTARDGPEPADAGSWSGRRPRRWPRIALVVVAALAAVAIVGGSVIRVPYVIISPGDATALDRGIVAVSGAPTYPHSGAVLYLTVRVTNEDPTLWRYLIAQLDGDVEVEPRQDVIGCATYEENARLNDELMTESQDVAKTVALRRLGYSVVDTGSRAVILGVECDGPARGHLMLGDVVIAVDGTTVTKAEEIRPLVRAHRPGDEIRVTVQRGDATRDETVRLGARSGTTFLGIVSQTMVGERFPFEVRIDTQRVSGPSAGLAFALAIVDELTPGDLTGGRRVAVTGAIASDGTVTPVGGVAQKTVAARRSGARLMLVPAGEAEDARARADGMKVVAVRTLDDALDALERVGGTATPPTPSGQ